MSYPKLTPITAKGATKPRYLEDRFADIINIKDYGAIGDGVANDTTAFTNAVATNKVVFIPSGTYSLTTNFTGNFCSIDDITFTGGTVNGSTILRGQNSRNNDLVNVKDFGAKGDGTTDDVTAFSAAVTAAAGAGIFIPRGSYLISDDVSGNFFTFGGVTFSGDGTVSTVKDLTE